MPELRTYSLHRRLIVWLVIPVLVMSTAILLEAYVSARESAQAIYDRLLLGLAFSISEHTVITEGDLLSDEVLEARRAAHVPAALEHHTPWEELYRAHVGQLADGGCLEFATRYRSVTAKLPRHSH